MYGNARPPLPWYSRERTQPDSWKQMLKEFPNSFSHPQYGHILTAIAQAQELPHTPFAIRIGDLKNPTKDQGLTENRDKIHLTATFLAMCLTYLKTSTTGTNWGGNSLASHSRSRPRKDVTLVLDIPSSPDVSDIPNSPDAPDAPGTPAPAPGAAAMSTVLFRSLEEQYSLWEPKTTNHPTSANHYVIVGNNLRSRTKPGCHYQETDSRPASFRQEIRVSRPGHQGNVVQDQIGRYVGPVEKHGNRLDCLEAKQQGSGNFMLTCLQRMGEFTNELEAVRGELATTATTPTTPTTPAQWHPRTGRPQNDIHRFGDTP
ncbi:hypothetical protein B0H65DRAFT_442844 [Neurospora tetraspora]|uniref:Uncharacterized protein n=1 Tax=Neurospora tetraspora TaxID=94610 RepID=A0AAE0MTC3_9PEZI|nr:hypothetical protein B0H65DRAFT_442844 [Neurospora tetraspora]